MFAAAAAAVVGAGLYFADGIRELASARLDDSRETAPPPAPATTPQAAGVPTVIGKWEDTIGTSWRQEIRIVMQAGHIVREITLPDGRVDRDILTEVTPRGSERRRFENLSSTRGQAYAITRQGHLAIFDKDGFVNQATKFTTSGERR